MCIVCRIGEGRGEDLGDARLNEILKAVRQDRKRPVALRCNVDTVYRYQNPGQADDTREGELFNAKRDLDVLQKLGLKYGDTMPARRCEGVDYYAPAAKFFGQRAVGGTKITFAISRVDGFIERSGRRVEFARQTSVAAKIADVAVVEAAEEER
jgi:hypothetical protein